MPRHPLDPPSRPVVLLLGVALALGAAACGHGGTAAPAIGSAESGRPFPADAPRLVLFLAVDQGSVEAIERYRPLLAGGLARLYDEGVVFADAHHSHATTETAPGHATLATGRHPSGHGIVANAWYDPELGEGVYSFGDPELGRSPRNLLASTLGDWLKDAAPEAVVVSLSGKDRSALAFAGKRGDGAYWYDRGSGTFVTSDHYRRDLPAWLEAFHGTDPADRWFGSLWEPLPEVAEAAERLGTASVEAGALTPVLTFPHPLGGVSTEPDQEYYSDLYRTPFVDRLVAEAALAAVDGEAMGTDGLPDLLALSFSALDTVGHPYGPDSPEYLDTLVRLDRTLGDLFDGIDRRVGLDRVVVSLSSDHGVLAVPEVMAARGEEARRLGPRDVLCIQRVGEELDRRFGEAAWLLGWGGEYFVSEGALVEHGVAHTEVEASAGDLLAACPGIARVWTATELAAGNASGPQGELYLHAFHPERSPDLLLQFEERMLPHAFADAAASHGSPYAYDTHVPWIVLAPGRSSATVAERVETVDVAPTVAELAGLAVPESVDGVSRVGLLPRGGDG